MLRLTAVDWERFLYVTGVLGEAGVPWQSVGGNELRVPDDTADRLTAEQRDEIGQSLMYVAPGFAPTAHPPADGAPPGAPAGNTGSAGPGVTAPPRSGAGATRAAWAAYAAALGLTVADDTSRDDIIAMVDQQEAHGGS